MNQWDGDFRSNEDSMGKSKGMRIYDAGLLRKRRFGQRPGDLLGELRCPQTSPMAGKVSGEPTMELYIAAGFSHG